MTVSEMIEELRHFDGDLKLILRYPHPGCGCCSEGEDVEDDDPIVETDLDSDGETDRVIIY